MVEGMARDEERAPSRSVLDLTERQRIVLRAVVEDYVLNAIPVGSQALVERYGLPVSSATVLSLAVVSIASRKTAGGAQWQ